MNDAPSLEQLYDNLEEAGVETFACPLSNFKALAQPEGFLGVNPRKVESVGEERTILIHEEGHFATGSFYAHDSPYTVREHQETIASRYGFKKYFPLSAILAAMDEGYLETWQLAEHFDLPESYILELLAYYTQAQGVDFEKARAERRRAIELAADPLTEHTRARLLACAVQPATLDFTEAEAQRYLTGIEMFLARMAQRQKQEQEQDLFP